MPLVRVDMHAALADRRAAMSEAIHAGLVEGREMQQRGCARVVDRPTALGFAADSILIALTENGDGDWFAPAGKD